MTKSAPKSQVIVEFLVVAVCTLVFALTALGICGSLLSPGAAGRRDFVEYWASGNLIAHHADPYNAEAILKLERSAGFPPDMAPIIMGNPPSALLLVLPLGLFSPTAGELVWELLLLISLAVSVSTVRKVYGQPKSLLDLLGYSFAPALSCLLSGQVTIFLLLGLALFLRWNRTRPFLAGAALWFCLLKPHLFVPFGLVLLLWIVLTRSYRVLMGTIAALSLSSAVATSMNPAVWTQYGQMMRESRLDRVVIPSASTVLRQYVYPHTLWVQCLPVGFACVWALAYFWKHREGWDWKEQGSLLMLLSVFSAPYTWFMDQAVLIPAILRGAYQTRSRTLIAVLALMSAIIEVGILSKVPLLHSNFYLWTAPAWLAWYWIVTGPRRVNAANAVVPPAEAAIQPEL